MRRSRRGGRATPGRTHTAVGCARGRAAAHWFRREGSGGGGAGSGSAWRASTGSDRHVGSGECNKISLLTEIFANGQCFFLPAAE